MKVCVVGGNGNIGASVVRALLDRHVDVTCFNRGLSGAIPDGARHVRLDRNETDSFEREAQSGKFDVAIDLVCFNGAAAASSIRAFKDVGHFIQCSSIATYGRPFEHLPAAENHPNRPNNDYGRGKAEADEVFLAAHKARGFPVTIVKPSITFGPKMGLLRQIGLDTNWLARIRHGRPIVVSGDGTAIHQFMHADDAGRAFALMAGRRQCVGQIYNLAPQGFTRWSDYHRTAMTIIGQTVPMVGVPAADLLALRDRGIAAISDVFSHNSLIDTGKLCRDLPDFVPQLSLFAAMTEVMEVLTRDGRIPETIDASSWEDRVIAAQQNVREIE